ncbi:hypothetical protein [Streptomyces mirabilis]|uniref:hypothetical protein n=1 Tax=Streptomyces mirabilis TaxID=68239 RepID=UPI0036EBAC6F
MVIVLPPAIGLVARSGDIELANVSRGHIGASFVDNPQLGSPDRFFGRTLPALLLGILENDQSYLTGSLSTNAPKAYSKVALAVTCKAEISRSGFSGVKHLLPHPRIEFQNLDLEDPDWK